MERATSSQRGSWASMSQSSQSPKITEAASVEGPPRPAQIGMRLVMEMA